MKKGSVWQPIESYLHSFSTFLPGSFYYMLPFNNRKYILEPIVYLHLASLEHFFWTGRTAKSTSTSSRCGHIRSSASRVIASSTEISAQKGSYDLHCTVFVDHFGLLLNVAMGTQTKQGTYWRFYHFSPSIRTTCVFPPEGFLRLQQWDKCIPVPIMKTINFIPSKERRGSQCVIVTMTPNLDVLTQTNTTCNHASGEPTRNLSSLEQIEVLNSKSSKGRHSSTKHPPLQP